MFEPTPRTWRLLRVLAALGLSALLAAPVHADVYVLKDGRTVDGKTLREKGGFVYVKTLTTTEKIALADVESMTEGESAFEVLTRLRGAVARDKKDVAAHWELCRFLREHAEGDKALTKDADKLLAKVLSLDTDHKDARDANGDVWFEGEWIKKSELSRRKAEAARRKLAREWSREIGMSVEVEEGEHFVIVCALEDVDLPERIGQLDEAYALLTDLFQREQLWSGRSPAIQVHDRGDYEGVVDKYGKKWGASASWYAIAKHESAGGCWRVNPPTQLRFPFQGEEALWFSQVHMVGHLAAWKLWGKMPPAWIPEGLGQWVEYEVMGENMASCIGTKSPKSSARDTSDASKKKKSKKGKGREEINYRKERLIEALNDDEFPSLRKFLGMQLGEFSAAEEGASLALVEFILQKDREKFAELFAGLSARGAQKDEPWNVLGYELVEELEKDWKVWVLTEW